MTTQAFALIAAIAVITGCANNNTDTDAEFSSGGNAPTSQSDSEGAGGEGGSLDSSDAGGNGGNGGDYVSSSTTESTSSETSSSTTSDSSTSSDTQCYNDCGGVGPQLRDALCGAELPKCGGGTLDCGGCGSPMWCQSTTTNTCVCAYDGDSTHQANCAGSGRVARKCGNHEATKMPSHCAAVNGGEYWCCNNV